MKKTIFSRQIICITSAIVLLQACVAKASVIQPLTTPSGNVTNRITQPNYSATQGPNDLLNRLWDKFFNTWSILNILIGGIGAISILYAGYLYLGAKSPEQSKKARQIIGNVILGVAIITASFALLNAIIRTANYFSNP